MSSGGNPKSVPFFSRYFLTVSTQFCSWFPSKILSATFVSCFSSSKSCEFNQESTPKMLRGVTTELKKFLAQKRAQEGNIKTSSKFWISCTKTVNTCWGMLYIGPFLPRHINHISKAIYVWRWWRGLLVGWPFWRELFQFLRDKLSCKHFICISACSLWSKATNFRDLFMHVFLWMSTRKEKVPTKSNQI